MKKSSCVSPVVRRGVESPTSAQQPSSLGGSKRYTLTIHGDDFSRAEVIVNPTVFPTICVGDIVEISQQQDPQEQPARSSKRTNSATVSLIVKVRDRAVKGIPAVSVLKSIAETLGLQQRKDVTVCESIVCNTTLSHISHILTCTFFFSFISTNAHICTHALFFSSFSRTSHMHFFFFIFTLHTTY